MTPEETREAKAERLDEERAEEEHHERRHREKHRAPKAPATTLSLQITCKVPEKEWALTRRLGFREADLPAMVEGMIHDLADQAENCANLEEIENWMAQRR